MPDAAYIVAVEPVAPYAVTVLRFTARALEQGRATYRAWLERLLVCRGVFDSFPPYAQSIVELDVPPTTTWGSTSAKWKRHDEPRTRAVGNVQRR